MLAGDLEKLPHEYMEGDAEPRVQGVITDENGAFNLTGYTVRMVIDRDGYGQNNLSKDATVASPTTGVYDFGVYASTDLVCGKDQRVTIQLIDGSANKETIDRWLQDVGREIT